MSTSSQQGGPRPSVVLHLPEEPLVERERWRQLVEDGADWGKVVDGEGGPAAWLWDRWRALGAAGMDGDRFSAVVAGYRRELWYWLLGERQWVQVCSGLIGRVGRRLPAVPAVAGSGPVP